MPDINMQHFGELQRNQHSIDVEIDASQVASPQQDFPMMLETPNSSNSVLNVVAINELGEQLPTEIEGIANDKNWVHLKDLVQSVINRKMKVFYGGCIGKPAADSAYGSQAVWGGYSLVYLMNDNPNGDVANSVKDSTANGYDATPNGAMTSADLVDDIGKAIDFDGSNDYLDEGTSQIIPTSSGAFTLSVISTQNSYTPVGYDGVVGLREDSGDGFQMFFTEISSAYYLIGGFRGGSRSVKWTLTWSEFLNERKNIQYIYNSGSKTSASSYDLYIDGVLYTTGKTIFNIGAIKTHNIISADSDGASGWSKLTIEQVTINPVDIGADYAATTHKNLNNPTANGSNPFYKSISKEHNFVESLQSLGRAG